MSNLYSNSIFFVEVDKIHPNPYQPRREFEETKLRDLAESVRMYGILQPLVVSRVENIKDDGGIQVSYELIAGERRLRASKIAGLLQVPVIIRTGDDSKMKLELAIIENLQREDLNAVERARAFLRFVDEFSYTHAQIGLKMGKSREYVSNTLRLLQLPEEILNALSEGKISEGHTRPLMMLSDRPEEQLVLFKEIMFKRITVREAERIARRVAQDKVRKKELLIDPEIIEFEKSLQERLGTRVHIERGEKGGKIEIDFFSNDDLHTLIGIIQSQKNSVSFIETTPNNVESMHADIPQVFMQELSADQINPILETPTTSNTVSEAMNTLGIAEQYKEIEAPHNIFEDNSFIDDRSKDEIEESSNDDTMYNVSNFSV